MHHFMPTTHIYRFIEGELLGKDRVSESDIYKMVWFIDQMLFISLPTINMKKIIDFVRRRTLEKFLRYNEV